MINDTGIDVTIKKRMYLMFVCIILPLPSVVGVGVTRMIVVGELEELLVLVREFE